MPSGIQKVVTNVGTSVGTIFKNRAKNSSASKLIDFAKNVASSVKKATSKKRGGSRKKRNCKNKTRKHRK